MYQLAFVRFPGPSHEKPLAYGPVLQIEGHPITIDPDRGVALTQAPQYTPFEGAASAHSTVKSANHTYLIGRSRDTRAGAGRCWLRSAFRDLQLSRVDEAGTRQNSLTHDIQPFVTARADCIQPVNLDPVRRPAGSWLNCRYRDHAPKKVVIGVFAGALNARRIESLREWQLIQKL